MEFAEDVDDAVTDDETFVVRFEAWEGPVEALLDLARAKKVDLAAIDMLELVSQFEAVIRRASGLKLELAADWLVAAAWLAYLKSRLLLERPKDGKASVPGEDVLSFRLRRLAAVKDAVEALEARNVTGRDWFGPGGGGVTDGTRLDVGLTGLLAAYPRPAPPPAPPRAPDLKPFDLASVDGSVARIARILPPDGWVPLLSMIPRGVSGLRLRSEIASALVGSLELAKRGEANVAQESCDDPVMVRRRTRDG